MRTRRLILVTLVAVATARADNLMVDHVPDSLLTAPVTKTNAVPAATGEPRALPTRKRPASPQDRWEKFEAEFGINTPEKSLAKSSIQSAKYQIDHTTFLMQEFVDTTIDRLSFDVSVRELSGQSTPKPARSSSGSLLLDTFNEARFQSDIDLKLGSRQFVGVKLVFPLGD